jgi:hypothetical protein
MDIQQGNESRDVGSTKRAAKTTARRKEGGAGDVGAAKAVSEQTAKLREILKEAGLRESGLRMLDADHVVKLAGLLKTGGERSNLCATMFNAVADTTPDQVSRLIDIMEKYTGAVGALSGFLRYLGEENPFLAAQKAQILVLPPTQEGTTRGVTGQILKGVSYCAYDPAMPTSSTGYQSAKQAITKILDAFCPEKMTEVVKEGVRSRRARELRNALQEIDLPSLSLQDFEEHPELRNEIRQQLIARNLQVYDELRKAIEEYKGHLSDMVYGGQVVLPGINSLKVSQDPGRQFFGWFEEHLRENPNAPQGIQLAYASLRDPNASLSEREEANYLRGLVAYQRLHSFINKDAALGGMVSDLKVYEGLELTDPLRMDPNIESARRMLQHTIASTPAELSITEFSNMLENAAMVQFRRDINKRTLDLYRGEFEKALTLFEFVSFENGSWREDALGDSVPMERLRQHLYGAKVGVATPWDGPGKKRAALGQPDFRHIMDAQFLRRLVADEEKLLAAKPIADFKEMVEGVVVAYRKAMFLEARVAEFATTPEGAGIVPSLDRENIGETLASWKPVLLLGNNYKPAEVWYAETQEPKPKLQSIADIADRLRDRKNHLIDSSQPGSEELKKKLYTYESEITRSPQAGLYRSDMDEFWRFVSEKVENLVPTTLYSDMFTQAARMSTHPMVIGTGYYTPERLTRKFVFAYELRAVQKLAAISGQVDELCKGYNASELQELRTRLDSNPFSHLYVGTVGTYRRGLGKLSLAHMSFAEFAGAQKPQKDESSLYCYEPEKLIEALDSLGSFVSTEELGRDWVERAKRLCSKAGRPALDARGFALVDNETYRAAQDLKPLFFTAVSREFAAKVNELLR